MDHFEMVEKLRQKANVSYEEAKDALEKTNWDLLDAMVYLEKEGRVNEGSAADYSTEETHEKVEEQETRYRNYSRKTFSERIMSVLERLGQLIGKGNANHLDVEKNGEVVLSLPLTVCVLLLVFMFWWVIPLVIIGLFTGFRFVFRGSAQVEEKANEYADKASQAAERIKKNFQESADEGKSDR